MNRTVGVVIVLIIVVMIWTYYFQLWHPKYETISLRDLRMLRTGDLILFKALDNWNGPKIGCYFGHIGVVWIDPDDPYQIPYLFEAAGTKGMHLLPHQNARGIFLEPLVNRIIKYKGMVFYKQMVGPSISDITARDFINFIEYAKKNMYYYYPVAQSCLRKGLGFEKCGNATNCGEITMLSLIKLGVLDESEYDVARPHHLRDMCYLTNCKKHKYNEPLLITFDPFSSV